MWKRIAVGLMAFVVALGALAWFKRTELILFVASHSGKRDVAENRPIEWAQGPDTSSSPQDGSSRKPNIIFILADDLGINDISSFGGGVAGGRVPTENIDDLAASGANFMQAYAGTASCAPSRAMIMTGRYPTRTGFEFTPTPPGMGRIVSMVANQNPRGRPPVIYHNELAEKSPPYAEQGLPGDEVTVAEVLKQSGYHTVHIGKWHLGRGPASNPNAQGFDESLLMASGLYLPQDDPDVVNARVNFDPIDQFLWARMQFAASFNNGEWFEPGGYLTDYWTDEAINVIHANRNRPFFLYLAHWGVHNPLQATHEDYKAVGDIQPHRLRVYAAMVRALDRSVGRIREALKEEGLDDNTIIVFSSDNGGAGYIGLPDINNPYRGWKLTLFEGGIRVPMFVSWPGEIAPGTVVDQPVAHIDLMPTLASAGQSPLPANVPIDGVDLLPFATRTAAAAAPHDRIFWQSDFYKGVRAGDWKLQTSQRPNKDWLYNLKDDPTEEHNLAGERPDIVAELKAALEEHAKGAVPPLYPAVAELPVTVDKTEADLMESGDEYVYWPN